MATVPNIFAGQNEPKLVDLDTNFASLGSMANQDSTGVNIDGGTIDGVTIGASVAPTVTNLGSVATCDINGGTIDGTTQSSGTINGPIAAGGTWTAAAAWTLPAHTLGGTVSLNGQSFSGTCADGGTFTTADINGGTIDGTVIGGSSRAAGSFTTLDANGNVTLGDASSDTVTINGYMGVGGVADSTVGFFVKNTALSGTSQHGISSAVTGSAAGTTAVNAFNSYPQTAAFAYTVTDVAGFHASSGAKGAGSTITNQHGLKIEDQTIGTNNYGITSAVSSGTNKWNIYASGTADNYFAGNLGVGVTPTARNNTRLQIVDGIGFPATQVASSDANTLDDYEEGTWTPTITFATPGDLSVAYSAQLGSYTKIGNVVHFRCAVVASTFTYTTSSGNLRIGGLPFTADANSRPVVIEYQKLSATGKQLTGWVAASVTYMQVDGSDPTGSAAPATMTISNAPSGNLVGFWISGTYTV